MPTEIRITPRGATLPERLALRTLQLGALATVLVAATYKVFELDRFFVPKELALHLTACLAGLLALGAARRATATRVDALLLGFLALGSVSAVFATNPWLAARALGVSVSAVAVFWVARALREAGLARPLLVALALMVAAAAATALLQTYGVRTDFFSLNRAPGGTLGNRNFIAHLSALGLPVLLMTALRAWRPAGFVIGSVGVALAVATLVLTRSRAGWLGMIAALGVLVLGWLLSRPLRRDRRKLLRFALLLLFAGGGVAAAILLPNSLRWRSDSPYLETARGVVNYREGSGAGRLVQYRNSLRMTLAHPLLGVGPGNWPVEYPEFAARRDPSLDRAEPGTTSNPWPSSDWVAYVSERGPIAFLLLALAGLGIAVGGWRRLRGARDSDEGLEALALLATLAAVAVTGAFDAVLLLAWPSLFVWASLGALWSPETMRELSVGPGARRAALLLVALLAGASAVRSAGQVAAMSLYAADRGRDQLELASRLDPGGYRVHLRLASRYGRRSEQRCEHALAARSLFPHADAARRAARGCD